jgi:hypothetical protein
MMEKLMVHDIVDLKESDKKLLLEILKALRSIRHGYVQIVVQDSKVVQIDKTEKIRFDKEGRLEGGGNSRR